MTRGNQRELARARNQKKQEKLKGNAKEKGENKGRKLDEKRHRDAEVMRLKQQKANDKKGAAGASATVGDSAGAST